MESIRSRYQKKKKTLPLATPYRFSSRVWNERKFTGWADLLQASIVGLVVAPGKVLMCLPKRAGTMSWVRLYPGVQLELVGFINDYTNLTGQCTLSAGCDENDIGLQFNGGKALIFGAETALNHTLYLPHAMSVPIQASYTYTNAQFKSDFNSNFSQFGRVQLGIGCLMFRDTKHRYKRRWNTQISMSPSPQTFGLKCLIRLGYLKTHRKSLRFNACVARPSVFVPLPGRFGIYVSGTNLLRNTSVVSWRPLGARPTAPGKSWSA